MKFINFNDEMVILINKIVMIEKRAAGGKFFIRTHFGPGFFNDTEFSDKKERDFAFEKLKRIIEKAKDK